MWMAGVRRGRCPSSSTCRPSRPSRLFAGAHLVRTVARRLSQERPRSGDEGAYGLGIVEMLCLCQQRFRELPWSRPRQGRTPRHSRMRFKQRCKQRPKRLGRPITRGRRGFRACFGSRRSLVRIQSPRPSAQATGSSCREALARSLVLLSARGSTAVPVNEAAGGLVCYEPQSPRRYLPCASSSSRALR